MAGNGSDAAGSGGGHGGSGLLGHGPDHAPSPEGEPARHSRRVSAELPLDPNGPRRLSDDELKQFVRDLAGNLIFTDAQIRRKEDVPMVFMGFLLVLGGIKKEHEANADAFLKQVGVMYEYLSEAGPRSINGLPCFMSHKFLHRKDWERALPAVRKLMEQEIELAPDEESPPQAFRGIDDPVL